MTTFERATVLTSGKYAGIARRPGDVIDVSRIPEKTVLAMIQEKRIIPVTTGSLPAAVDSTEAGALDGVTGNIQTQLNAKLEADDLADYAKTVDLAAYAQTTAIANMVEDADLAGYIAIADLKTLTAAAADFAAFQVAIAAIGA